MPSTVQGDFYGTPTQADQASIPRKYVRTTDASTSYWREEVQTVSTAAAGGSTAVTAAQGTGSSVSPWFVAPLTTDSMIRVQDLTTASIVRTQDLTTDSKVRIESTGAIGVSQGAPSSANPWFIQNDSSRGLFLSTLTTITAFITTNSITRVEPQAGTTWDVVGTVNLGATPNGAFTLESGTTAHSTYAGKVSSVAGTTSLISSGTGRVRVLSVSLQQTDTASTGSQLVQFLSGTTVIPGAPEWLLSQREGVVQPAPMGAYLFQTSTGEALQISLSTNVKTMVHVTAVRTS